MTGQAIAGICAGVVKRRTSKGGGIMAHGAILVVRSGRYVVREFTHADHIIVTRVAATHKRRAGMTKGASAKRPRGVANLAILGSWHVFIERRTKWLAARCNTVTGVAPLCKNSRVGVVDAKCGDKTFGVMARAAICCRVLMSCCRRRHSSINTIVCSVAGFTRLYRRINQSVVENTTGHFERCNAVAGSAIDVCYRMADSLPRG